MYGKIFESMYEGTLYGQWEAIVTMQQLIVLANSEGVIDMTPPAIAGKTSIPLEIIEKGLAILAKPDQYSRTPGSEGVRIKLLDEHRNWGWFLVNHEKYTAIRKREDKLKADRERMASKRNSLNNSGVANSRTGPQGVANVAHEDEDEDENEDISQNTAPPVQSEFDKFKKAYPARNGQQRWKGAQKALNARLKEGHTWQEIIAGTKRYHQFCDASGNTGNQFVMQAATFVGTEKSFLEPWLAPIQKATATDSYYAELQEAVSNANHE